MKTLFILNAHAGSKDGTKSVAEHVNAYKSGHPEMYIELHETVSKGDAEGYTARFCEENASEDEIRVIACGGDGTVNDVLNSVIKYPNAVLGIIPIGTGNDFCRNLTTAGDFSDIGAQMGGEVKTCDSIRYSGMIGGKEDVRYCLNMFNIGFDCNVVDMTASVKRTRFISGSLAYLISVLIILIKKKGANLKIELDGKVYNNGSLLLTSIANGSYCGGGVKSNPLADISDGKIDVNIVHNVSRLKFLRLFPSYQKGTHVSINGIEKIVEPHKCVHAVITPLGGNMRLCADGEITDAGVITFDLMPDSVRLLIPRA